MSWYYHILENDPEKKESSNETNMAEHMAVSMQKEIKVSLLGIYIIAEKK